jgi:hypothetical protein
MNVVLQFEQDCTTKFEDSLIYSLILCVKSLRRQNVEEVNREFMRFDV